MSFVIINPLRLILIFIRIKDWLHILGLAVLGAVFYYNSAIKPYHLLPGLLVSSLYLAHGFSLNNFFDVTIDQSIGKRFLPLNPIFHKRFLVISYALLFINCLISLQISQMVFWLVITGSALGVIYSAPPLRLKRHTFLNIALNSLGFSIIFLIGFFSASNDATLSVLMMSILFVLFFIPIPINTIRINRKTYFCCPLCILFL